MILAVIIVVGLTDPSPELFLYAALFLLHGLRVFQEISCLQRYPPSLLGRLTRIFLVAVSILVIFYGLFVWLDWRILQAMYEQKAGVDWFGTVFYHNYTFIVAGVLSLLVINPKIGKSDLWETYSATRSFTGAMYGIRETPSFKLGWASWVFWQFFKWVAAFLYIVPANGLPIFGNITVVILMLMKGIGNWGQLSRIFTLPIMPASATELKMLVPTMEVQYRLFFYAAASILLVAVVRMLLKLVRDIASVRRESWIRDLFIGLSLIVLIILLEAPYWSMDVRTPYEYFIVATLFFCFFFVGLLFHFGGVRTTIGLARRKRWVLTIVAGVLILILLGNTVLLLGFNINWDNNWSTYEWRPMTEKQIAVTSWAAGTESFKYQPLSTIISGNITLTLSHVRQWDQDAAYTKMKNQIGVNWMTLSHSDIVYYQGRELWVAPTTVLYPSNDWISRRLIYTHTSKVLIIDSHSGEFVPVTEAYGVKSDPVIYYGEDFGEHVYVNVKGFREIENASYRGEPDYTLSGWQRGLWFLSEGQLGFAFAPPQESISMLYKRDVNDRVQTILIHGLTIDHDSYLVSDGKTLYYAVQVYIDYRLQTGFSMSRYKRFFAVVLVNLEDGNIAGYTVGGSDGFLADFYRSYYPMWGPPPLWLSQQLRYPEQLLGEEQPGGARGSTLAPGQLDTDFLYHVKDPFVWRSGSDFYERPSGTAVNYILMASGEDLVYVGVQLAEYRASPGRNLAGLYGAFGSRQLGEIVLYKVSNATTTTQLIGPSAALQALETDDYVRTQLTLLTNRRLGNILLYSIGGKLYYFIPVYIITQEANAVITKIAFIVAVDAATGTRVATGEDATQAYYALERGTLPIETGINARMKRLVSYVGGIGYQIVNVTRINANAEIEIGRSTYLQEGQWDQSRRLLDSFIAGYGVKVTQKEMFVWNSDTNTLSFGVIIHQGDLLRLYYVSIRVR